MILEEGGQNDKEFLPAFPDLPDFKIPCTDW